VERDSGRPPALATLAVLLAAGFALLLLVFALRWPLEHDLPIFLYQGYLIHELGAVPYRDFFEVNAPGTMLASHWIHWLTDGSSLAVRILDMLALGALTALTMRVLRPHGWRSGALASACFAIVYLNAGNAQTLQREFLCMLPLALSIWSTFRLGDGVRRPWLAMSAVGALFAVTLSIKPTLVVCWIPLGAMALATRFPTRPDGPGAVLREAAKLCTLHGIGAVLAMLLIAAPIGTAGLASYLEIVREYYPLYHQMNGQGSLWELHGPSDYLRRYGVDAFELILDYRFAALSFLGLALAWNLRERKLLAQVVTLSGVALSALLYVPVTGKFWPYHSFPLFYALSLLAGLAVSDALVRSSIQAAWQNGIVCLAIALSLPLGTMLGEYWRWRDDRAYLVKGGRVALIARYLEEHTRPGEPVMALDTTSGALHGLYQARRPMYGRLVYDYMLYHHIDAPYIQRMRAELLDQIADGGFDVLVRMDDTWSRRPNFPELDTTIAAHFDVALQENAVTIFRRRTREQERGSR
jgi:hypothetical protein